jgi:hypothetical protein
MRPILAGVSRHAGQKRTFLGVVTALVTAALVAPALAGDDGAQRVDFLDLDSSGPCVLPPNTGRPDKSSAIINRNRAGTEIRVLVRLKDALPNTTYDVNVFENRCEFGALGFSVRTNDQGNANEQIEDRIGGFPPVIINDVVVTARTFSPASPDFKQTPIVTFGP